MVNKGKQAGRLNLLMSEYLPVFLGQHLGTGTPTEFLNFGSVLIVATTWFAPCMHVHWYLVSGSGDADRSGELPDPFGKAWLGPIIVPRGHRAGDRGTDPVVRSRDRYPITNQSERSTGRWEGHLLQDRV